MRLKQNKIPEVLITVVRGIYPRSEGSVRSYRNGYIKFSGLYPTIDELVQMYAVMDSKVLSDSVWVMNQEMYRHIALLKNGDRDHLVFKNRLFGCPIFIDDFLNEDTVLSPIIIGERQQMVGKVNFDRPIETGSVFIDNFGGMYIYRTDSYYHKNHLVGVSDGTMDSYLYDPSLPTANWIEKTLNISIEEGKNYFPSSKYVIDLIKDEGGVK